MTVRIRLAVLVCTIPVVAAAQRGRGGGGGGGGAAEPPPDLSRGDVQKFDPAKFFHDKRKNLALDVAQLAKIDTIERDAKPAFIRIAARFDTLQRAYDQVRDSVLDGPTGGRRSLSGGSERVPTRMTPQRQRMLDAHQAALGALSEAQHLDDSVSALVWALLTEDQRGKATPLLTKRNDDLLKMLTTSGYVSSPEGSSRRGRGGQPPG